MANTARHMPSDVAAMSAAELALFIATDYAGLQVYASLLATAKEHTTFGRTAQAVVTTNVANDKRNRLGF